MKTIAAFYISLALLLVVSSASLKVSEASVESFSQLTQPTPPANKAIKEIPSPTPECSPKATPLSEKDKNDPNRERTSDDLLNGIGEGRDWDCDGICNRQDNCIFAYNPDQKDLNLDGKGDACDPQFVDPSFLDSRCDQDRDGVTDHKDNCPWACNPTQRVVCDGRFRNAILTLQICKKPREVKAPAQTRGVTSPILSLPNPQPAKKQDKVEGITAERARDGLLGSDDADCDGIKNRFDNCRITYNADQKDSDGDGYGDACDAGSTSSYRIDRRCDTDGDGIDDVVDNCPWVCNPKQKFVDSNKNGVNDLCDSSFPNVEKGVKFCPVR